MTSITFEIDRPLGDGIWITKLETVTADILTTGVDVRANRTVIGLRNFKLEQGGTAITAPLQAIVPLVSGGDVEAVLLDLDSDGKIASSIASHRNVSSTEKPRVGDSSLTQLITDNLPEQLAEEANNLVRHVRVLTPTGQFEETKQRRKFVNRPENFVTLKVQPRTEDIRITVYGDVMFYDEFSDLAEEHNIDLKKDQNGYTGFKWSEPKAIEAVKGIVENAKFLKETRANRNYC